MNILITNDDGYGAPGLEVLAKELSAEHRVFVIAPDRERSACSSAITVRTPLRIEKRGADRFAIDGFPADCVNIGLHGNLVPAIHLVVSGINRGPNLGDDVYFSGTVAAARIAFIFGITGIAVSLDTRTESDNTADCARFVRDFIRSLGDCHARGNYFFNINYPDLPAPAIAGTSLTRLGRRNYMDAYRVISKNEDVMMLQLDGNVCSMPGDGTDIEQIARAGISITPLGLDCTDHALLNELTGLGLWR